MPCRAASLTSNTNDGGSDVVWRCSSPTAQKVQGYLQGSLHLGPLTICLLLTRKHDSWSEHEAALFLIDNASTDPANCYLMERSEYNGLKRRREDDGERATYRSRSTGRDKSLIDCHGRAENGQVDKDHLDGKPQGNTLEATTPFTIPAWSDSFTSSLGDSPITLEDEVKDATCFGSVRRSVLSGDGCGVLR